MTTKRIGDCQEEPSHVVRRTPLEGGLGQESEVVYLAQAVSDHRKSVELLGVVTVVPAYNREILSQRGVLRHSENTAL